ncbi:MAG: CBS domain-containing protein [Candidatus Margulisiibacteriota bacterium]|nr:CBS domain-containing protein [Candidatus Margulisiibacteriota bacterium]
MKKVKDFITRDLTSVTEDTPLKDVAELLSLRGVNGIPVVNMKNEVTGWISERDLITSIFPEKFQAENPDLIGFINLSKVVKKLTQVGEAMVKDHMIRTFHPVKEETLASDVADIMLQKNLKRIPVLRHKRLVGVVDRASLAHILLEEGSLD